VKIKTVFFSAIVFLLVASFAAVGEGMARENSPPGVGVGLVIDGSASRIPGKLAFFEGDPIPIVLTLENVGGDLITSRGFSGKLFYLYLTFTDWAGKGILADGLESFTPTEVHVPPPKVLPVGLKLLQVEAVEVLPGTASDSPWSLSIGIPNAHAYYTLYRNVPYPAGQYSVKASIPMRTYSRIDYMNELDAYSLLTSVSFQETVASDPVYFSIIADADGDGYYYPESPVDGRPVDCDDQNVAVHPGAWEIPDNGIDDDCNPDTVDPSPPQGTVALHAVKYLVGQGDHPATAQEPLANMPVKIMDMSPGSCVAQNGFKWSNYQAIWGNCLAKGSGSTDASGDLTLTMPPGEYAILGYADPNPAVNNDEIYISGTVVVAADTTEHVNVEAIVNPVGKFVPAKANRRTGSELWIIEPEYIEWTASAEYYPFIFRSIGDWNVTTSITPPEGFVADANALEADVNSTLTAVQFVVTDVGSQWVDTKVNHKVKHRGKTETIKTKIGVKNSKGKTAKDKKKK
jgi:hypothetical protein